MEEKPVLLSYCFVEKVLTTAYVGQSATFKDV